MRDSLEVAREQVTRLLLAMDEWGSDEDGIHPEAWDAYEGARKWLGYPIQLTEEDDGEDRYQCLSAAMAGEPWPLPEGGLGW